MKRLVYALLATFLTPTIYGFIRADEFSVAFFFVDLLISVVAASYISHKLVEDFI